MRGICGIVKANKRLMACKCDGGQRIVGKKNSFSGIISRCKIASKGFYQVPNHNNRIYPFVRYADDAKQ